jgi:hypothetical protein
MKITDDDRQLTVGELARAIERGSIGATVRGADYEINVREANWLRRGLSTADLLLFLQAGGGIEIGPGGEDVSQAI